jgi:hypothetical protein
MALYSGFQRQTEAPFFLEWILKALSSPRIECLNSLTFETVLIARKGIC